MKKSSINRFSIYGMMTVLCLFLINGCPVPDKPKLENDLFKPTDYTNPGFVTDHSGQGDILLLINEDTVWEKYTSSADFTINIIDRYCPGTGDTKAFEMVFSFDSAVDPWVVIRFVFQNNGASVPLDLSGYHYLLFPFKGDIPQAILPTLQVKLDDGSGLYTEEFKPGEGSDSNWGNLLTLPALRTFLIPLFNFQIRGCDLSNVIAFEIGIKHSAGGYSENFIFDDISVAAADQLKETIPEQDYFEYIPQSTEKDNLMAAIAGDLKSRMHPDHAFIPIWYPENPPWYHIYGEAEALIVLSFEYKRTNDMTYKEAAIKIADRFCFIQEEDGKWYTGYKDDGGDLVPAAYDYYVANIGWVIIGLREFIDNVQPNNETIYLETMDKAASWITSQIDTYGGTYGGVSTGTEANISSYFGLIAASDEYSAEAEGISDYLMNVLWKESEGRFWMGYQFPYPAIDVTGNWGVEFLLNRAMKNEDMDEEIINKALRSFRLAAAIFPAESWVQGISMTGMSDIEVFQPTTEFTAQYITAGGPGSGYLLNQLLNLNMNGAFKGAPAEFYYGMGWNTDMMGISPSAWTYFAIHGGFLYKL